ncbi:HAD family hydrolase [Azotosporobacter soli]|uniref:HAD family hydrolase n=1 Tax=Azotosporobacter soli TaxID=3055040 RepID=UPI0031FF4499
MRYEYILFDLDGTLTDPALGISNSIIYALKKYGIEVGERSELFKFIGPPLAESFEKYYGFSEEKANQAVEYFREYYRAQGIFENVIYDGIEELLKTLQEKHRQLLVATTKPEVFAKQILEHFAIAQYFSFIAGSNLDGTRVKKDEVIAYALESCKITDLTKTIMIGDREHDVLGAKKIGIASLGVLFGYGDRAEHEKAGADYIVERVDEIEKIVCAE